MVYVLSVVHNYDCDVTATRNEQSARLQEVAANHNAGIGMSVVDQLWRHCLLFFSLVFLLIKAIYCSLSCLYLITSISYVIELE